MDRASLQIMRHPSPAIRGALLEHYKRLGRESRLQRFMTPVNDDGLGRLTHRSSPILVIGIEKDGEIRGVLELFDLHNGHTEIGISIEDTYQGRGFGRFLIRRGIQEARQCGFETADLYFSSTNHAMRALCTACGADIRTSHCESIAFIPLQESFGHLRVQQSAKDL